jgi:hypothetical protein
MAMEITEGEEVASNAGFERGLKAGAAKERGRQVATGGGSSAPTPSAPDMNDDQSFTLELLIILGLILIMISPLGKWLSSLIDEITTYHQVNLSLNPFGQSSGGGITNAAMMPAPGGSSNNNASSGSPSLWNVPIVNSNGESGTIQVVSSSQAGATNNANQGGNTPTGNATPA